MVTETNVIRLCLSLSNIVGPILLSFSELGVHSINLNSQSSNLYQTRVFNVLAGAGVLGDTCKVHADCPYSHGKCMKPDQCTNGTCYCAKGYARSGTVCKQREW